jgi:aminoglycoside phosphotransferase (APT) family kinase protein
VTVSTESRSDRATLSEFLHETIFPEADEITIAEMARPAGGASWETWMLTISVRTGTSEQQRRLVVKRAPDTGPLAPYEVNKDVVIFETLAASEVPVPHLLAWTTDRSVFERPFTVTDFVEGSCDDITRIERWPVWQEHREELGHEIIATLAALQRFEWRGTELPSVLGPRGPQKIRVAASVDRYLTPLLASAEEAGIAQPLWRDMGAWIKENAPDIDEDDMVVIHGDYRFGNFLWQQTRIAAVVDWERAMLGDPMADLAFICMPLSRRLQPDLMGKALLFPQLVESYERASGRSVDIRRIQYWGVFWQFIEGVNSTRGLLQSFQSHRAVASSGFITPNLVARQTLRLMRLHDEGRDEL